jgi:large subunit ribosomal protein L47
MLALSRASPKHISGLANGRPMFRALAEVVGTIRNESAISVAPPTTPKQTVSRSVRVLTEGRIPVREDHGLYAFFRRKEGADLIGDARYEVVETPEKVQHVTGKPLQASCMSATNINQEGVGELLN